MDLETEIDEVEIEAEATVERTRVAETKRMKEVMLIQRKSKPTSLLL